MNYQFTLLQWKRISRSSFWQKSLITNIFIGLLLILLLLELLGVGIFLPKILEKSGKGIAPEDLLNQRHDLLFPHHVYDPLFHAGTTNHGSYAHVAPAHKKKPDQFVSEFQNAALVF